MNNSLAITQLPSMFRCYDVDTVGVRGLYFHETKSVARYVAGQDMEQLANIYKEVITGINVLDLEISDFSVLMIISSIWTVSNFSWNPRIRCNHLDEEGNRCNGTSLSHPVVLDDFDFDTDSLPRYDCIDVVIKDTPMVYRPKRVRDQIALNKYIESLDENDPAYEDECEYARYACVVHHPEKELSVAEKVDMIKYATAIEIEELNQLNSEMLIRNKPVEKVCSSCGKKVLIKLSLDQLRGYP